MLITEREYVKFALGHPDEKWELHYGKLRKKPDMTWDHNLTLRELGWLLRQQLDRREYDVVMDQGRVQRSAQGFYIPDVYVVPVEVRRRLYRRGEMEMYSVPLPLVVEVWSPSTGDYDVEAKLPQYQQRGDLEIWRIHPYEKTVTVWRRQPDGSYEQRVSTEGVIVPVALPGVTIDVASLFDWE